MVLREQNNQPKWDLFLYHVLIFIGAHILFVPFFGLVPLSELNSESYLDFMEEHFLNFGINIYQNTFINQLSGIWKSVLFVHLIIELIDTLFPVKKQSILKKSSNELISSRKAWGYLLLAGLLEIIWAAALKLDMLGGPVIIILILSFDLLIKSVKRLGVGTAYAVFTGIGSVGLIFVDFFVFKEPLSRLKIFFVSLLIIFIIGLKLTSNLGEEKYQ